MNALVMFIKDPVIGKVKTRLGTEVGQEKARQLYVRIVKKQMKIHDNQAYCFMLGFAPPSRLPHVRKMFGNAEYIAQSGGNLGTRMSSMAAQVLSGFEKVCIIGSDIPGITSSIIKKAFGALNANDIVIGPCFDGGYYLIGMKKAYDVFSGISWSTPTVLEDTLAMCKKQHLSTVVLPMLHDLDNADSLRLLRASGFLRNSQALRA